MFWKFGFHATSPIESLLDKEGVTLEELLDLEDLLQECKSRHRKLIDFLGRLENVEKLLNYLVADNPDNDAKKTKHAFLANEIFCAEIEQLYTILLADNGLLQKFWDFIDRPAPLNDLQASYFARLNVILLQKKTTDALKFIRSQPDVVNGLLKHIGTSAISDMIMKLVSLEDFAEGVGTVEWLASEGLIVKLFNQLDPHLDKELHITATQTILDIITISYQNIGHTETLPNGEQRHIPHILPKSGLIYEMKGRNIMEKLTRFMLDRSGPFATSSLTHGISIVMELIRRYCTDIEQIEAQQQEYTQALQQGRPSFPPPSIETIKLLSLYVSDLLAVLRECLQQFVSILKSPQDVTGPVPTTMGLLEPVGSERLKVCELFAEIIHLQYLFTSSPLFEGLVQNYDPVPEEGQPEVIPTVRVIDELLIITDKMVAEKVFILCLDLFFKFKWNNFLHSVVYDMIAKILNTYTFTTAAAASAEADENDEDEDTEEEQQRPPKRNPSAGQQIMRQVRDSVKAVVLSIFEEGDLTKRITEAQKESDAEQAKPKGIRTGYMGHLTYISDEAIKVYDKCGNELGEKIIGCFSDPDWVGYVEGPLKATKERDQKVLGGARPDLHILPNDFKFNNAFALASLDSYPSDTAVTDFGIPASELPVNNPGDFTYPQNRTLEGFTADPVQKIMEHNPQRFGQGGFSGWHPKGSMELRDSEIEFDVKEALDSENLFSASSETHGSSTSGNGSNGGNGGWKPDFEGAFGTRDLREALETSSSNPTLNRVIQDAPGEEWSDYSNTDGS